jgi:hypothetical protein
MASQFRCTSKSVDLLGVSHEQTINGQGFKHQPTKQEKEVLSKQLPIWPTVAK